MLPTPDKLHAWLRRIERYSEKWWYALVVGFFVFLDLFILIIPGDALIISSALLQPKRWWLYPLAGLLGTALGAIALSWTVQTFGVQALEWTLPGLTESSPWKHAVGILEQHGWWGLAFVALSFLPQQPAVAAYALAEPNLLLIAAAVALGRTPKYFAFAYGAIHAPKLFHRIFPYLVGPSEAETLVSRATPLRTGVPDNDHQDRTDNREPDHTRTPGAPAETIEHKTHSDSDDRTS